MSAIEKVMKCGLTDIGCVLSGAECRELEAWAASHIEATEAQRAETYKAGKEVARLLRAMRSIHLISRQHSSAYVREIKAIAANALGLDPATGKEGTDHA